MRCACMWAHYVSRSMKNPSEGQEAQDSGGSENRRLMSKIQAARDASIVP